LLSTKSTIRYLPPNGTAGFERKTVSGKSRSPFPPARINARTFGCAIQPSPFLIPSTYLHIYSLSMSVEKSIKRTKMSRQKEGRGEADSFPWIMKIRFLQLRFYHLQTYSDSVIISINTTCNAGWTSEALSTGFI